MTIFAATPDDVIVGVDTHKHVHVAVAITGTGGRLDELSFPTTTAGYDQALIWAKGFGSVACVGIEGTSSYGKGLTRHLANAGIPTVEITRPPRAIDRRRHGKSDSIDAELAARQVLSGQATAAPKTGEGSVEDLRVLRIVRSGAVKARTQAMVTLKSMLVTANQDLREQLAGLSAKKLVTACAALDTTPGRAGSALATSLVSLAGRWLSLDAEITALDPQIRRLTNATAPQLLERPGIGPESAGELLVAFGDNRDRLHTDAEFARLCGVCPIPTGSGATNGRHRLNRGGNRQANAALHRIAIVRIRCHEPTQNYLARRLAEGKTRKETIRCIKRYIAREIFNLLRQKPLDKI